MLRCCARLLVLLLVPGCFTPELKPAAGVWTYNDVVVTENTCEPIDVPSGEFTLTVLSEGNFTIELASLQNALSCSNEDESFTCPESLLAKFAGDKVDATLVVTVEIEGTFASPTEFSGSEVVRQSCIGADCEALVAAAGRKVPCSIDLTFTGQFKE